MQEDNNNIFSLQTKVITTNARIALRAYAYFGNHGNSLFVHSWLKKEELKTVERGMFLVFTRYNLNASFIAFMVIKVIHQHIVHLSYD